MFIIFETWEADVEKPVAFQFRTFFWKNVKYSYLIYDYIWYLGLRLHNIHIGISKLVEQFRIGYLLSDRLKPSTEKPELQRTPLWTRNTVMRACSSLVAAIEKENYAWRLPVDFSKKVTETQLNRLFVAGHFQECSKEWTKRPRIWFPILVGFIDQCTRWMKEAPLMKLYSLYSELVMRMEANNGRKCWCERQLTDLKTCKNILRNH